jgi:NMT1/THI5 like
MPNHILKKLLISVACLVFAAAIFTGRGEAQLKKVRMAVPGYTISMISFFAAKMNGYYAAEGLEVELIATRAPTANLAVLSGSVEFSAVPLAGLTTALLGGPLKKSFSSTSTNRNMNFSPSVSCKTSKPCAVRKLRSPASARSATPFYASTLPPTGSMPATMSRFLA